MVRTPLFHRRGIGLILVRELRSLHAAQQGQKKKEGGGGEASELRWGGVGGTQGNSVSSGQLHSCNSTDH